jgi:hypothetical protein
MVCRNASSAGVRGSFRRKGVRIQEEVERIEDGHLRDQIDLDREHPGRLREDEPRAIIALRILLPVDEMLGGLHPERITENGGAAMRGRLEPHRLRPQHDRAVVAIGGAMKKGDVEGHEMGSGKVGAFSP